jgi:hypothetical protein
LGRGRERVEMEELGKKQKETGREVSDSYD